MIFVRRGIFVPIGNRCCSIRLYNGHLSFEAMPALTSSMTDHIHLDSNAISHLLDDCCSSINRMKTFDLDDPSSLDITAYNNITGLQRSEIISMPSFNSHHVFQATLTKSQSQAGSRVVGFCAHIIALIWQLGVYVGQVDSTSNDLHSARFFDFVRDAAESNTTDDTGNDKSSSDDDEVNGED